jgi:hypothetical protein
MPRPSLALSLAFTIASATAATLAADPAPSTPPPAPLPTGFRLAYEQHFDTAAALRGFAMSDTNAWEYSADGSSFALELARQSKYQASVRSPFNIALIADQAFGDFTLEADLVQTGKEYGHRDMCLFFGFQDPTHFYYVHLATAADDHAHNIFIVNGAPRTKIARETTKGVNWGLGVWHKVRLERRLADGSIRVYFDDLTHPIMVAEDKTFGSGWIGFGSFDDTGKVDNIRIWSPTSPEPRPVTVFGRSGRP